MQLRWVEGINAYSVLGKLWDGGDGALGCDSVKTSGGGGLMRKGIERRRAGVEWEKENPAPLTPPRLVSFQRQQKL